LQPEAADLSLHLNTQAAQVETQRHAIKIVLPASEGFGKDSSTLKPAVFPLLQKIAANLKAYPATEIAIVGYTDNEGSKRGNIIISEERARAIANYLFKEEIMPRRIKTYGYGSANPRSSNTTAAGRAKNRRVEIYLYPRGGSPFL